MTRLRLSHVDVTFCKRKGTKESESQRNVNRNLERREFFNGIENDFKHTNMNLIRSSVYCMFDKVFASLFSTFDTQKLEKIKN
jgi:hypothetical protein